MRQKGEGSNNGRSRREQRYANLKNTGVCQDGCVFLPGSAGAILGSKPKYKSDRINHSEATDSLQLSAIKQSIETGPWGCVLLG